MSWMGDPPMVFHPLWWWYTPDPTTVEVEGAEIIRWEGDGGAADE